MYNDVPVYSLNLNQYVVQFTLDYNLVVAYEKMCPSYVKFCLETSREKTLANNNNYISQIALWLQQNHEISEKNMVPRNN